MRETAGPWSRRSQTRGPGGTGETETEMQDVEVTRGHHPKSEQKHEDAETPDVIGTSTRRHRGRLYLLVQALSNFA